MWIQALDPGTQITIQYLDRTVCFIVKVLAGENILEVISVENSSLQKGDILHVYKIRNGAILEADSVIRGSNRGNYRTTGEIKRIELIQNCN